MVYNMATLVQCNKVCSDHSLLSGATAPTAPLIYGPLSSSGTAPGADWAPKRRSSRPPWVLHHATQQCARSTSISPPLSASQKRSRQTWRIARSGIVLISSAVRGSHSFRSSTRRKESESIRASMSTACAESGGALPRSGVELFCTVGAMGVVDAWRARSRTTSSNIDGSSGWLFASGEGGAVTWMTVLKARRNCLADRFSGNTYARLDAPNESDKEDQTYCKQVLNVKGQVLRS